MPSVVGLLEQWAHHSPSCRDLREEADRLQAELAVAEREWKTVASEWRAGLASSALSVDYQRILQALSAHICCGDHHREQQAKGVDDVPLAAVDQLAVVEAAAVRADDRVRFDRLRVDHARARLRVPPGPLADQAAEPVVELADQILVAPAPEGRVDPVPQGKSAGVARRFGPLSTR